MSNEERRLTVIVGAGASHSCAGAGDRASVADWLPPLAQELFDPRYCSVLTRYPGAEAVSDQIRTRTKNENFEAVLRSLETLQDIHSRRQY